MKQKGFTLIELLVVIAIIGLLASVILISLNSSRMKARDAKRAADMDQIYKALNMFYLQYDCLPVTSGTTCAGAAGYSGSDAGGFDYSSQGNGFLTFLNTSGIISAPLRDPLNNMSGDGLPANTYAYRYNCYPSNTTYPGLHLGYWRESDGQYVIKSIPNTGNTVTWSDSSFICK